MITKEVIQTLLNCPIKSIRDKIEKQYGICIDDSPIKVGDTVMAVKGGYSEEWMFRPCVVYKVLDNCVYESPNSWWTKEDVIKLKNTE